MTSKYDDLLTDMFALLKSVDVDGLSMTPVGFEEPNTGDEYLKFSIIPNGSGLNRVSASGVIQIIIHPKMSGDPRRPYALASMLDDGLVAASSGQLQLPEGSTLSPYKDGEFLYTIPFKLFRSLQ